MKLYREENIKMIMGALDDDEYDDTAQDEAVKFDEIPSEAHNFLKLFLKDKAPVLEIGCGSGDLFGRYGITHGAEPSKKRYEAAAKKGTAEVRRCVSEALVWDDKFFEAVMMLNGFFQVRSDYESLIEVNRVLRVNGVFIFNLITNDKIDVVCGRCLGPNNYLRLLTQFGFELIGRIEMDAGPRFFPQIQSTEYMAVQKVRDFDPKWLSLPQVPRDAVVNYVQARDWRLL
jgi:SAM-dependent methyltransferase